MTQNDRRDAEALPEGWATATINEMIASDGLFSDGDWVESKDQDPDGDVRLIQLADIGDGVFRDRSERHLTSHRAAELGCTFLERGDLLIARMPRPLGRACIFPGDPKRCVTAVDVCIVRTGSQSVDHGWLMFATNSPQIRAEITSYQSGSTRKRISRRNLAKIQFHIPPLPEQHRIVAEIETQFTRLAAGIAALKRAQANLRRYKAALLKAACEGRLLSPEEVAAIRKAPGYEPADVLLQRILAERRAQWEAEHPRKTYKEPTPPDTSGLPVLPGGWVWATWEQLSPRVTVGHVGKMKDEYIESGIPFLRSQNVRENRFDPKGLRYISPNFHAKLKKSTLHVGDLVVVRSGSVGVTCVIPQNLGEANCSDLVIIKKPFGLVSDYGSYYMNSLARRHVKAGQVGIALTHFNTKSVAALPIAVPPFVEQTRITVKVERRLSVVAELENQVEAALRRAERLRQAILKRAFAGRLVPQDPNDEPASALLERIGAQRQGHGTGKGKRRPPRQERLPTL